VVLLIGYVDRFSARPGERIAVKVSSQLDRPYRADLVQIIHADANPAAPGIKLAEIPAAFAGTYASRFQPVHAGSCGVVTPAGVVHATRTLHDRRSGSTLAAPWTAADGSGNRRRTDPLRHRRGCALGAG